MRKVISVMKKVMLITLLFAVGEMRSTAKKSLFDSCISDKLLTKYKSNVVMCNLLGFLSYINRTV